MVGRLRRASVLLLLNPAPSPPSHTRLQESFSPANPIHLILLPTDKEAQGELSHQVCAGVPHLLHPSDALMGGCCAAAAAPSSTTCTSLHSQVAEWMGTPRKEEQEAAAASQELAQVGAQRGSYLSMLPATEVHSREPNCMPPPACPLRDTHTSRRLAASPPT